MSLIQLALVMESSRVPPREANEVGAALQRQLTRDFGPVWDVQATLDVFPSLDAVPPGYWPILVRDELPDGIIGIHIDHRGQPFALVRVNPTWSLTASHEALEMVADPWGNRLIPGPSPVPDQGIVEFLIEVCDPVGGVQNGYTVNGVLVSDFYTPEYFDATPAPGVRYSFTGSLDAPRTVLREGYLSWREPVSQDWWQLNFVEKPRPAILRIGRVDEDGRPLRERIDAQGGLPYLAEGAPASEPAVADARRLYLASQRTSLAQARSIAARIGELYASVPEVPVAPVGRTEGPIPVAPRDPGVPRDPDGLGPADA